MSWSAGTEWGSPWYHFQLICEFMAGATSMAVERTLSIIKPDAVARNVIGEIYARFEKAGLKIVAARMARGYSPFVCGVPAGNG